MPAPAPYGVLYLYNNIGGMPMTWGWQFGCPESHVCSVCAGSLALTHWHLMVGSRCVLRVCPDCFDTTRKNIERYAALVE